MANFKPREIPLNGKLFTAVDALMIGGNNFRTLKNLRYTDTNPQGIQGMTKINSTALSTYLKTRSGIHFKKSQPAESHLLIQAWNTGLTAAQVLQNTTAIGSTGDFSGTALHTDAAGFTTGLFSNAPGGNIAYCNSVESMIWGGDEMRCAGFINLDTAGTFSYDFTDQVTNTLTTANNIATLTSVGGDKLYLYIGSTRPLKGIKFYIGTANTTAETLHVAYWSGGGWTGATSESDGTDIGGVPFAQTGLLSFDDTVSVAKIKIIEGIMLYWYRVRTDNPIDDTTTITHCTVDASFQSIKDLWDGNYRTVLNCQYWDEGTTSFNDFTTNIAEADYDDSLTATYMDTDPTNNNDAIYLGFIERQSGLAVTIADRKINNVASTLTVAYWNGTAWTSLTIDDGTDIAGDTFKQSGIITWTAPELASEFKTEIGEVGDLYYYKLSWNNSITSSTRWDKIVGIPAPQTIGNYKFPVMAQERLWLCNNTEEFKNSARCCARNAPEVWNGGSVETFYFGGEEELTAGLELYSQFSSNLYNMVLFTKANETYAIVGSTPEDWKQYRISETIGCIAPQTMRSITINVPNKEVPNIQVAIWQGIDGIYLFDGRAPIKISGDISNLFDPNDSNSINTSYIDISTAFVNEVRQEYHWLFASGSSTTLDKEMVYDIKRNRWYEIARGSGLELQVGIEAEDTIGNKYNYGLIDTGYMERLENGTDFDGTAIAHEMFLDGLFPHEDSFLHETSIRKIFLAMVAKATTDQNVSVTHYGNSNNTGGTAFSMDPTKAGYRVVTAFNEKKWGPYVEHALKFTISTDDETIGFEPLKLGIMYEPEIRKDKA